MHITVHSCKIYKHLEEKKVKEKNHKPNEDSQAQLFCKSHMMHNTIDCTIPMWYIIYCSSFEYFRVFAIILLYFCCAHFCCILLNLHKHMNCERVSELTLVLLIINRNNMNCVCFFFIWYVELQFWKGSVAMDLFTSIIPLNSEKLWK